MDEREIPSDTTGDMNHDDAVLLDQLIDVNFNPAALDGVDDATRARAQRLVAMMGLLEHYPVEPVTDDQRASLIAATMARINRDEADQRDRMQLDRGGPLPRMRFRELIAVAAVLILGLAIILPMIRSTSQHEGIEINQARLLDLSTALNAFEDSHDSASPSLQLQDPEYKKILGYAPTILDVKQCMDPGTKQETSDKQLHLVQLGDGFSFHSQQPKRIVRINLSPKTIIVSDRNSMLPGVLAGRPAATDKSLRASVLFNDGSTDLSPCHVEQDHIWDCDRQRVAGKPMFEIFLIHARMTAGPGSEASD